MNRTKRKIIRHPSAPTWKDNLRSFSMRIGFNLSLSRAMLEFVCAVADDVSWDRALYHSNACVPENFLASSRSLEKRGLIERKDDAEREKVFERQRRVAMSEHLKNGDGQFYEHSYWKLTPAGDCVVKLLKLAGMFIEADAAINKRSRKA